MSNEREGASLTPKEPGDGPSPDDKGDGKKALLFFFGAIALILAPKVLLGY